MPHSLKTHPIISRLLAAVLVLVASSTAHAEFYMGAGIGKTAVEIDNFDEDDSSKKLIAGYIFDLPAVDFSVEGSYIDLGSPYDDATGSELDASGIGAFAIAGIDFGLVGLFAKAGALIWDADAIAPGLAASDDGTDPAYGIGVRFNISSLDVRAEYEKFDIDYVDDVNMLSASLIWRF